MSAMDNAIISLLGKMTGLTPDQMQALSNNAINLLMSLDNRLAAIEDKLGIVRVIEPQNIIEDKSNVESHN